MEDLIVAAMLCGMEGKIFVAHPTLNRNLPFKNCSLELLEYFILKIEKIFQQLLIKSLIRIIIRIKDFLKTLNMLICLILQQEV